MNGVAPGETVLKMKDISKRFTGVVALDNVSLELHRGEVLILVGENGAGKSTLMKILAGAYQKDSGDVWLNGKQIEIQNPLHAHELGISIVFQELALMPDLDAIENIFMGREITSALGNSYLGVLNRHAMLEAAKVHIDAFDARIDPTVPVQRLGLGQRQVVEIIRALVESASIIIMDEPTAALEESERLQLFRIIRKLRETGVGIIYVSHHLEECLEIGDRIMVLRDGRKVGEMPISECSVDQIITLMVGKTLTEQYPKETVTIGQDAFFKVDGLSHRRAFSDVSFEVKQGEIVGIAGLSQSGKSELARTIFGAEPSTGGSIELEGRRLPSRLTPDCAIDHGIAFLPADRKGEGLFLEHDVKFNIGISNLKDLIRGWIRGPLESSVARDYVRDLAIKTPSINQTTRNLSGGNQQKVMLARWLFTKPRLVIFEEPTRGIDVNAKVEVYRLIGQIVRNGGGVIIVSTELPELEGLCDRVLVMHEGHIAAELPRGECTQEKIAYYSVTKTG